MKAQRSENYHGRPDWLTRAMVDAAIELRHRESCVRAATFLALGSVPIEVTLRVLTQSKSPRTY
jgi:hypothetical protein